MVQGHRTWSRSQAVWSLTLWVIPTTTPRTFVIGGNYTTELVVENRIGMGSRIGTLTYPILANRQRGATLKAQASRLLSKISHSSIAFPCSSGMHFLTSRKRSFRIAR